MQEILPVQLLKAPYIYKLLENGVSMLKSLILLLQSSFYKGMEDITGNVVLRDSLDQ